MSKNSVGFLRSRQFVSAHTTCLLKKPFKQACSSQDKQSSKSIVCLTGQTGLGILEWPSGCGYFYA